MNGRWTLPSLAQGDLLPEFKTVTRANPAYHFSSVAGRYVLLALMPRDPAARAAALAAFAPISRLVEGRFIAAFFVAPQADGPEIPPDNVPGQRWFFDPDGDIARTLRLPAEEAVWLLMDPALRVLARAPIDRPEPVLSRIAAGLPPLGAHAGTPLVAPVLIVPRVFEPAFCRRLIDIYEERGGYASGVMRDVDGRTVGILDNMKRRSDVNLEADTTLRAEIVQRLSSTVLPMISRTYQFRPTRVERHLVACYDAAEGGYFMPHRDDETLGTVHRRFACSINLNSEDFEGGDLRFPEFGDRTYRPPTGGGVVFACNLLHEATPVTRGRRYAFLPFFYDEEGQRLRERNEAFLDSGAARVSVDR